MSLGTAITIVVIGVVLQITGMGLAYIAYKWYMKKLPEILDHTFN